MFESNQFYAQISCIVIQFIAEIKKMISNGLGNVEMYGCR